MKQKNKWYKKLKRNEKKLLWIFLGALLIISLIALTSQMWMDYNSRLTTAQCQQVGINTVLEMQSNSFWENVLIDYAPIIKILLVLIGLAWLFHGVQVRVLA